MLMQTQRAARSSAPTAFSVINAPNPDPERLAKRRRKFSIELVTATRVAARSATGAQSNLILVLSVVARHGSLRATVHIRHPQDKPVRTRGSRDSDRCVFQTRLMYFRDDLRRPPSSDTDAR